MAVAKSEVEEQLRELGDFHQFFTSKEIRHLPEVLSHGETIHGITSGFFESRTWIVVVTDMRILFLDKGMFYGLKQVDIPLSKVSSVSQSTGLFFGEIEVNTASGGKKITSIPRKSVVKITSILSGLIHGPVQSARAPEAPAYIERPAPAPVQVQVQAMSPDLASQLERLDVLYQKGVLTDDEFSLSKSRLIDAYAPRF